MRLIGASTAPERQARVCHFCSEFNDYSTSAFARRFPSWPLKSRVLAEWGGFRLLPDIAPLSSMHCLLIPRAHADSMLGGMEVEVLAEAVDRARDLYEAAGLSLMVFEHGDCGSGAARSSCIDHAHLHLIPREASLVRAFSSHYEVARLPDLKSVLHRHRGSGYLLLGDLGRNRSSYLFAEPPARDVTPQYFRRLLARAGGEVEFCWRRTRSDVSRIFDTIELQELDRLRSALVARFQIQGSTA